MVFGWIGLIFGFSGLIFVHELGHFVLAKWNGVRVYVFSLGMGPYLISFSWRGTVYALSLIPIGGYVKLQGQDDLDPNPKPTKDPHDYRNKRPGQKAAILAAGAIFNLLFTLAAFTVCYAGGIEVEPPRLGLIVPGKPLAEATLIKDGSPANLKEGDRILEVNGVPVKTYLEAMLQVAGTPRNENITLRVERHGGAPDDAYVSVKTEPDKKIGAPGIGLNPYSFEMPLPLGFATKDAVIVVEDPGSRAELKNFPAARSGKFEKGDIILEVGGRPIRKIEDMIKAGPLSHGKLQKFVLERQGKQIEVELTPEKSEKTDDYLFGIPPGVVRQVVKIDPGCEAYRLGLRGPDPEAGRAGDYVFGFRPDQEDWAGDNPYTLLWRSGKLDFADKWDAKKEDIKTIDLIVPPPDSAEALSETAGGYVFNQERMGVEKLKTVGGVSEALSLAWGDTVRFSGSVFTVLRGLFTHDVDVSALSGGLGIGYAVYKVASTQTMMKFLWFLAFISLNLGVLQFIPIPLLDGWHLLMVLVEKMKGSAVSPRVQEAFQYVGIFIVGGLLLLATYNDIIRIFVGR